MIKRSLFFDSGKISCFRLLLTYFNRLPSVFISALFTNIYMNLCVRFVFFCFFLFLNLSTYLFSLFLVRSSVVSICTSSRFRRCAFLFYYYHFRSAHFIYFILPFYSQFLSSHYFRLIVLLFKLISSFDFYLLLGRCEIRFYIVY